MSKNYNELVDLANQASQAYYDGLPEIMTNKEWDALFDEIVKMESETGIIRPDSPTQTVGSDGIDNIKGKKETHEYPALSLPKSKNISDLIKWAGERAVWLSWKLDGLTLVVTYDNGALSKIVTRGNGKIGTNITFLKDAIHGIPKKIGYKGHMVARGEALISYEDFIRINDSLPDDVEKYANPRNLASGTLALSDPKEVAKRNVQFLAFTLVHCDDDMVEGMSMIYHGNRMEALKLLGFNPVPMVPIMDVTEENLSKEIDRFTKQVESYPYPADGLVICYDDWNYAQSGNLTGHHSTTGGFAFKWADETVPTVIRDIEWSTSRTGLLNPVAIFDPVELCGTTVSRASMFNLSCVNEKDVKIGDRVMVFKANMIIPQIDENLDANPIDLGLLSYEDLMNRYNLPERCPCCGEPLHLRRTKRATSLRCANPECPAKLIGRLVHFCERDCMNVMDLSEKKLQQLIDLGIVKNLPALLDLYVQYNRSGDILFTNESGETLYLSNQDGWGKKSVAKLAKGIENACNHADFARFMHAMGIPNVGNGQAKLLAPAIATWAKDHSDEIAVSGCKNMIDMLGAMKSTGYDFKQINGIGDIIAGSLENWIDENLVKPFEYGVESEVIAALSYITFTDTCADYIKDTTSSSINGLTFVVTGDVHIFKNRKEVEAKIESLGGKLSGSVSKKTSYLINNDVNSTSGKNQKAKELAIPILTEEQFCDLIGMEY